MDCLGIDIGGSSVKLAAMRDTQVLWQGQSDPYAQPDTARLISAIRQAAAGRIDPRQPPDAVGLCVPGLLDMQKRTITLAVNVPGLVGIVLDELIARALEAKAAHLAIVNDALASGVDLVVSKGLQGRVLCLALGSGVGISVLDHGKPLLVEGNSPGHIGQIDVSLENEPPIGPDGGAGSLEAYIGAPALAKRYGSTEAFYQTAAVTDVPLRALVRAIRICHAIYRPHYVVLAGGVGIRLRRLIPSLKQAIDAHLTRIARNGWTLDSGEHGFHAALGAARLAGGL